MSILQQGASTSARTVVTFLADKTVAENLWSKGTHVKGEGKIRGGDEGALVIRAQAGDAQAMEELVESLMGMIVKTAKKYTTPRALIDDLVQEGRIGAMKGIIKYDTSTKYKLTTYTFFWIRQYIAKAAADLNRPIRLPYHILQQLIAIQKAERVLTQKLGRAPDIDEIAKECEITTDKVLELRGIPTVTVSTSEVVNGSESELGDILASEEDTEFRALREDPNALLLQAIDRLPEAQRIVVVMRFGLDGKGERSFREIASELGLSQEGVRQRQEAAFRRLRRLLSGKIEGTGS